MKKRPLLSLLLFGALLPSATAAIESVDNGSYTTTFPGTDIAGRNGFPGGMPQVSGTALGRPIPTNDWWSALLNSNHAANLFNYPLAMRTLPGGLDIGLIEPVSGVNGSSQPLSDISPVIVGVSGLSATRATVDDYSDWTVTIAWDSAGRSLRAKSGIGMPFVYFTKGESDVASVTVNVGTVSISGETLLIVNSQGGATFAVYAPAGSTWSKSGNTYTSTLAGKDYWSLAILAAGTTAADWRRFAFVEPVDTRADWSYDEASAILRTEFTTTVQVREGAGTTVIQGLLPHQWAHLAPDSPAPTSRSMNSIRGELKLLESNTFATERTFHGILPTLPAVGHLGDGFDPAKLNEKISLMENDTLSTWTDSYNEGQVMNRLIQTARIAHETGDFEARDKLVATVKERLEDWLIAEVGEVAFLFYYQPTWTTLIGYPAGHGQDTNINDHHFHWGYFIHAAAFMEQFEPGWAAAWGGMVELLVRDAATPDRSDALFPYLRSFSPFAGHCWANGFATFPFGNDQESSSESMQFNSALIHWGAITGNNAIRDLGIYLYTTEQSAIEEYWLDINERTFKNGYGYSLASRIWGNGYDNQTFWTSDIAAAYGIELYPIHGGSLYLGHDIAYATKLWTEMTQNTGILSQAVNDNLWHDVYWQFLAFTDPAAAIALYNGNPNRNLKFGVSDAQTYYWLHSMNILGQVDASITANDPLAVVFNKDGQKTYVAHNYSTTEKTIDFSDGARLTVPAGSLATSLDLPFTGTLSTPFPTAPAGNTVTLTVTLEGDTNDLEQVEFFDGAASLGSLTGAPYVLQTGALAAGRHTFFARLHTGSGSGITGSASVNVGDTFPFSGSPIALPGTFDSGSYDRFEGGNGQDITYHDSSVGNNGDYRPEEYVDASSGNTEGAVIGWIDSGEWLDYTVEVAESGLYTLAIRYASGNAAGGGPLFLELDGQIASGDLSFPTTGNWSTFATATLPNVELRQGRHVLRLNFKGGEVNIGRLTFTRTGPLEYAPPMADAGPDGSLTAPETGIVLDGSASTASSGGSLTYAWEQIAGPAVAILSDAASSSPAASGLVRDGLYRFQLTVNDGAYRDFAVVEILRGELTQRPPTAAILSPSDGTPVTAGQAVTITISARDPDGEWVRLDFFNDGLHLGSLESAPYAFDWYPPEGNHTLTVRATDSDGLQTTSAPVNLTANPPLPCTRASASGDFEYEFITDGEQTDIVFLPSRSGVGANIVLFYYGTGGGPYPGYPITPGVPFRLNASEGETINFYFTYSVPEGGERNTIAENMSYTIGTCGEVPESDPEIAFLNWQADQFDPGDLADAELEATLWGAFADPEGDGLANWIEFVNGSDPLAHSSMLLHWQQDLLTGEWRARFKRRAGLPDSFGQLQWSDDLLNWGTEGIQSQPVSLEKGIGEWEATFEVLDSNPSAPLYLRQLVSQ